MIIRRSCNTIRLGTHFEVGFKRLISSGAASTSPLNDFVKIRSVKELRSRQLPEYISTPHSKLQNLIWTQPLQNVYLVKKPWQPHVRDAMVNFIKHLHDYYPACNVIVDKDVGEEILMDFHSFPRDQNNPHYLFTGESKDIIGKTDLLVTLGGDGTILRGVSFFSNTVVPPVLSFSLGTLGFLLPFDFNNHIELFKQVYSSRSKVLHRTRIECHIVKNSTNESLSEFKVTRDLPIELTPDQISQIKQKEIQNRKVHAMNDIVLHRGSSLSLATLDIYIDGEFLTRTTLDGLLFSTPTGSTLYSLSAGGSIVNPLVPSILLTPICPRSLSFRPLILPSTSHIMVKVGSKNNVASKLRLSIDGVSQTDLCKGDEIHVTSETGTIYLPRVKPPSLSQDSVDAANDDDSGDSMTKKLKDLKYKGIWCVAKSENDWVSGINELLGFNSSFKNTKIDGNK